MTRGGRNKEQDLPERRCLATGETQPKAGLIRFVAGPDGQVLPDLMGKVPGRGFYVTADRVALETAIKKKLFSRGAKTQVTVPDGLMESVELGLVRRVTDLISLARKAGLAIAGYEKVKSALDKGQVRLLIQASDGSPRGKSKLSTPQNGRWLGVLTASELGLAFGREHVIHGALAAGGLTERVIEDAAKLSGLRKIDDGGKRPARKDKTTR